VERASHAGLAAGFVALAVSLLSFYPGSWTPVLAAAAALAAFVQPRAGLAFALAVPFLPLGDISSGLAIAYLAVAIAWVATFWNDPRHSLLFVTGPLLGLLGAIALVPLIAERAAGAARRALQAGVAVLLAALAAGLRSSPFPFSGETPPLGLGIAGSDSPGAVLTALWGALAAHPAVGIEAVLLAATAAALPLVRRYGLVGAAALGSILPVAMLLAPPLLGASRVDPVPVLVGAVGLSLALVVPALRERRARDPSVAGGTAKT
jgi:hypothetical protein